MKVVNVIPLQKGAFIEDLTYFTAKDVLVGNIVSVPLRNKNILGLVISIEEVSSSKSGIKNMSFDLKKVIEVKEHSVWKNEFLKATLLCAKYFASRKNDAVTTMLPAILREKYDTISNFKNETLIYLDSKTNTSNIKNEIKSEKLLLQLPLIERISFYKTLIRESFALKKSIFLVLPNQQDIKVFFDLLSKGIENFSFAISSAQGENKIIELYKDIIGLAHPILVICTTQFLSIPRHDIGTIILEKESSNGYKMISRPYFDQRVFVEIFASKLGVKLIFADTMLRYDTIGRKEIDNFNEMYPLSFRLNFEGEIEFLTRDKKLGLEEPRSKGFHILKSKTLEEIEKYNSRNENILIFSLRKGLATITVCRDCDEPLMCKDCGAPMVLYLSRDSSKRMFICNRCRNEMDSDTICPKCGSWNLVPLGIGTDTVVEELRKKFQKEIKIFQLDKESAKNKIGASKIIREFENKSGSILVGTEMALIYLKNKIPLSVVASFDSLWSIPSFKMSEKILQLILTMLSKTSKKLIIQTKNIDDPLIEAVKSENLLSFVREELEDRKKLGYPPYVRFIKITYHGHKEETQIAKKTLNEIFKDYSPEIFSGFIAKSKNEYVTNILLKLDIQKWSLPEISHGSSIDENLLIKLLSLPQNFSINVDPEDLL